MNPSAAGAAIVFAFLTGGCAATSWATPTGPGALCFAIAAAVSWVACISCFLLGAQKGRPR